MTQATKVIECSGCGAPITFEGESLQVQCAYCGTVVMVPEELRSQPVRPAPEVVIIQGAPAAALDSKTAKKVAGGIGCSVVLMVVIPLLIIGAVAVFFLSVWPSGTEKHINVLATRLPAALEDVPGVTDLLASPVPSFARLETSFAGKGTGPGLFQDVRHIALDGKGYLYAVEYDTLRIQRFDNAGTYVGGWTIDEKPRLDAYRKRGPDALAADAEGHVYALWDGSLLKYDGSSGELLARFSLEKGQLGEHMVVYGNTLIAFADNAFDDTLLWIDTDSGQIVRRVPKLLSSIADENMFVSHMKLAVDGLGNLFVLYTFPNQHQGIYRFGPEGKYVDRFSARTDAGDQPLSIESIAVDNQSRIYVDQTWQINVFDADGRFLRTIPGSLYELTSSEFGIDRDNHIFVLNRGTAKIYKLSVIQ